MELWNFIRNMFNGKNLGESENRSSFDCRCNYDTDDFGNSVWQNDDIGNFRNFRGTHHFHIFNDPFQMARYFESQIENILQNFIGGYNGFNGFNEGADMGTNVLPFVSPQKESLRDQVLKPNSDLKRLELDMDLDGKVTADNVSSIWDEQINPKLEPSRPYIIGKSVRKECIRRADGTIEQKQVIKDYNGNEETIISYQIGDKICTIHTKKDKNGVETKISDTCEKCN